MKQKGRAISIYGDEERKAKLWSRYNKVPYLTRNTIQENTRKHNIQESQEASPFPVGDHKAAKNRQRN